MISKIFKLSETLIRESDVDAVGFSLLDFKNNTFESFVCDLENNRKDYYFDLASLTKPLTNSIISIKHKMRQFDLLLNHRAGLPAWGLLPKNHWKEQILSYSIQESETLYSDFSALRFMLETEKYLGLKYENLVREYLDEEVIFWKDLKETNRTLQNGYQKGIPNFRSVHDPNAYNLNCFTSHAGLFGTIDGLSHTLLRVEKELSLIPLLKEALVASSQRFNYGFDRAQGNNSLAGQGASEQCFGHLGFTGTSFWIDCEKELGHIILTNSTKRYWFKKEKLNNFRREVGALVWRR